MRRARRSGRPEAISPKRGGNGRLRANRRDTPSTGEEGRHKLSCVGVRRESHRRRMVSSWQRSGRGCVLLGTSVVAAIAISGTGFASARMVGMQQAVYGSGVGKPREDGEIGRMKPRRLDACSSDSDCTPDDAEQVALDRDNRDIFCDDSCQDTGNDPFEGLWCNYLGKDGCRGCDTSNCVGTSGDCVPCNGEVPEVAPTSTPVEGATRAPVEADEESCTTARCEERASDDDLSYIDDNNLTLYCDSKCLETTSDPFLGLWCNMRGLGQPCRACRADNCVDWDRDDTCVPCDEVEETLSPSITTPAPSQPPETLAPSEMVPTPVPSEITPTAVPIATEAPALTPSPVVTVAPTETAAPITAPQFTLPPDLTPPPGISLPPVFLPPGPTPAPGSTLAPTTTAPEATIAPTNAPTTGNNTTLSPSTAPSMGPTRSPSVAPTVSPTRSPTVSPTRSPTVSPTRSPTTVPTGSPTAIPTTIPTAAPTAVPTAVPTRSPTAIPTAVPTGSPTAVPTAVPTGSPTAMTAVPTGSPTAVPTAVPTGSPTAVPTAVPTGSPTGVPTAVPTGSPTAVPTAVPTGSPTTIPTAVPTGSPTAVSSTMTARVQLNGVTGTDEEQLQEKLENSFMGVLSSGGDDVTVNVTIDPFLPATNAFLRIRGRRSLQDTCSISTETCTVEAIATVTYKAGADDGSGGSSARGVDNLSIKDNFAEIASSAGVDTSDVTLESLKVSADPNNLILDDEEIEGLVLQTFSSDPSSINYWLFILACALLLMLWLCCLCWAYLRYSNAKEESSAEQARRSASSTGRWGGDGYRDPPSPSKGVDSIERAKMDAPMMDQKRKEKIKSMGGNDSQVGLRSSLEDIPEESGSSAGDPSFKDNRSSRVNMISQNSVRRNSWEDEEDDDDDDDDWEASRSRSSFREGRAVPSGRQVLSRGKQRSTGSSSFSDELVAQRGPEARRASAGARRNTFSSAGESSTSNEIDRRTSNTSNTSGGMSGSGSGGISSSFTSSAGVTSSTVEDDHENNDQGSSDYDSVSKDDATTSFPEHGAGAPERAPETS